MTLVSSLPCNDKYENQHGIPAEYKAPIWQGLDNKFHNIQKTILEVQFTNPGHLQFPGSLTIAIETEFFNPPRTTLAAASIAFKVGLFKNEGLISSTHGRASIKAEHFDNDLGTVESYGSLKIRAQTGQNKNGVILTASSSEIAIYGQFDLSGGIIQAREDIEGLFGKLAITEQGKIVSSEGHIEIITCNYFGLEGTIQAAKDISLTNEEGTFWIQNGLLITPNDTLHLQSQHYSWQQVEALAKGIQLEGTLAEFLHVNLLSQGEQNVHLGTADFLEVCIRAQEGRIKLKTKNIGTYESCQFVAHDNAIACTSKGTLEFQHSTTVAKQTIDHSSLELIDIHSSHIAEQSVTQFADKLISRHSFLGAEDVSIDTRISNSKSLTVVAKRLQAESILESRFSKGRFRLSEKGRWSSSESYVDLIKAEIDSPEIKVKAHRQVEMDHTHVKTEHRVRVVSEVGGIHFSHSQISGKGKVAVQATQGMICLNHTILDRVFEATVRGRYAQIEKSNIVSLKNHTIDAVRTAICHSSLSSEQGGIGIIGSKSIQLEKVRKVARHGTIEEVSEDWISEKKNKNHALQINRSSSTLNLIETTDHAKKVCNAAQQSSLLAHYTAIAQGAIALNLLGHAIVTDSGFKTFKIAICADELWSQGNQFQFDQMLVHAYALNMLFNKVTGDSSFIYTCRGPAIITQSEWKTRFNAIKTEMDLSWTQNQSSGRQHLSSQGDQQINDNTFSKGDLILESRRGNTVVRNTVLEDMYHFESNNPEGSVHLEKMNAKLHTFSVKAQELSLVESQIDSEFALEAKEIAIDRSHLQSNQAIAIENAATLRLTESTLNSKASVSLNAENALLDDSKVVGKKKVQVKTSHADILSSEIHSTQAEVDVSINEGRIQQGKIHGRQAAHVNGEALSLEDTLIASKEGESKIAGEKLRLNRVNMIGVTVTQKVNTLTSIASDATAAKSITRTVSSIRIDGGTDKAPICSDTMNEGVIRNHTINASQQATTTFKDVSYFNNNVEAPTITMEGTVSGADNSFVSNSLSMVGPQIDLPFTRAKVNEMNVRSEGELALHGSDLEGHVKLKNKTDGSSINISLSEVKGSLNVQSKGDLDGSSLKTEGQFLYCEGKNLWLPNSQTKVKESIAFQSEGLAHIAQSELQSEKLQIVAQNLSGREIHARTDKNALVEVNAQVGLENMQGDIGKVFQVKGEHINLNRSQVSAETIIENGKLGVAAVGSSQMAQKTLVQESEQSIDTEKATLQAKQDMIVQKAKVAVLHQNGHSQAPVHYVEAQFFDNKEGILQGDLSATTCVFDNRGGHLQVGSNDSRIKTDTLLTSSGSKVSGEGVLSVAINGYYHENSQVDMTGTYLIEAQGATVDSTIKAKNVQINTFDQILHISKQGHLAAEELAATHCYFLDNQGQINSQKDIGIHQVHYQDPGAVKALSMLLLSSDSSIELSKPMHVDSSLGLVSKGAVRTYAPLEVGNDLIVQGSQIGFFRKVNAAGRGILICPQGELLIDHTQVNLQQGIDVHADRFIVRVSDVNVVGQSTINTIQCNKFLLAGEVEVPLYSNTPSAYTHRPSNFRLLGDLHLKVNQEATNRGSNFLVTSNGLLEGRDWNNINLEHLYSQEVEIGKVHKRKLGFRGKSKKLYATERHIVVDGWANTQFSQTVTLNLENVRNCGGIFLANKIEGVASLYNGIFSNIGNTPTMDLNCIPCLEGLPTPRPGGAFLANESINVAGPVINNNGWIDSQKTALTATQQFFNGVRVVEEQADCIVKRTSSGKAKVRSATIDRVQPGGMISGIETRLDTGPNGRNVGGVMQGRDLFEQIGHNFDQEAIKIRSIEDRRLHHGFERAKTLSGNSMMQEFTGSFSNTGSDVISWGPGSLIAAEIIQRTIFATNVDRDERRHGKRRLVHSIEMEEGRICSIAGPRLVKTTQGNIDVEGEVGSLQGHLTLDSAQDIHLRARTEYAENRRRTYKASFGQIQLQSIKASTSQTSLPHLYAGEGSTMKGNTLYAEGAQINVIGDTEVKLYSSHVKGHKVNGYVKSKGATLGIKFLGSDAIRKGIHREKPKAICVSALREDPGLSSLFDLVASRDGVDMAKNGVLAIAHLWNEGQTFYNAFQNGGLGRALGEHFGVTDGKGNVHPRITLSAEFSKQSTHWSTFIPSRHLYQGNLLWKSDQQLWEGAKMKVTGNAKLLGENIVAKSEESTVSSKGKSITPGITFGPKVLDASLNYQQLSGRQNSHSNFILDCDQELIVEATEQLGLFGAELEGDTVKVKTPKLRLKSQQDTSSHTHWQAGASTAPGINFAYSHQAESRVNGVTAIRGRQGGLVDANNIQLTGAALQNVTVKTSSPIEQQEIIDSKTATSFNVNFAIPENKGQPVLMYGAADFRRKSEKSAVLPTITGENADQFQVNRDLSQQRKKIKSSNWHFGAPLVSLGGMGALPSSAPQEKDIEAVAEVKVEKEAVKPKANAKTRSSDNEKKSNSTTREKQKAPKKESKSKSVSQEASSLIVDVPEAAVTPPSFKAIAENSKQQLFLNPVADSKPIKHSNNEGSTTRALDRKIEERLIANDSWETRERMAEMELAMAPARMIEAVCNIHPKMQKVCQKVAIPFEMLSNAISQRILPSSDEKRGNRKKNVARDAEFKFTHLNIPIEDTLRYHENMEHYAIGGLINSLGLPTLSGIGKIPSLWTRPNLVQGWKNAAPAAANANKKQIVHVIPWGTSSNIIEFPTPPSSTTGLSKMVTGISQLLPKSHHPRSILIPEAANDNVINGATQVNKIYHRIQFPKYVKEAIDVLENPSITHFNLNDPRKKVLFAVGTPEGDHNGALSLAHPRNHYTLFNLDRKYDLKVISIEKIQELYHAMRQEPEKLISAVWIRGHGNPFEMTFPEVWNGQFLDGEAALRFKNKVSVILESCEVGKRQLGGVTNELKDSLDLFNQRAVINSPKTSISTDFAAFRPPEKDGLLRVRFMKTFTESVTRSMVTETEMNVIKKMMFENYQKGITRAWNKPELLMDLSSDQQVALQKYWEKLRY